MAQWRNQYQVSFLFYFPLYGSQRLFCCRGIQRIFGIVVDFGGETIESDERHGIAISSFRSSGSRGGQFQSSQVFGGYAEGKEIFSLDCNDFNFTNFQMTFDHVVVLWNQLFDANNRVSELVLNILCHVVRAEGVIQVIFRFS